MPAAPAGRREHVRRRITSMLWMWLVRGTLALAALAVMVNGASWELTDAPAAANELVMARSVIDAISGDTAPPTDTRSSVRITSEHTR